jgi:oxygen-independent coproporphyrinogen-3 oxidase
MAVQRLRNAGIGNISIDLMYGFPGETLADWQRDIDAALALDVEHLSAYCLMIEEGTPLYELINKGDALNEELERQMYELLIDQMKRGSYEHYEISNFAKPGFRSRHNSSYWHDVPYIGIGAAAHSYDLRSRSWNVANILQYITAIEKGERPAEQEEIDDDTHYNDRITTALRTIDGLNLTKLSDKHRHYCMQEAQRFLSDGLLRQDDQHLILTRKGLFVSDMVMSSLMLV